MRERSPRLVLAQCLMRMGDLDHGKAAAALIEALEAEGYQIVAGEVARLSEAEANQEAWKNAQARSGEQAVFWRDRANRFETMLRDLADKITDEVGPPAALG